jgi:formylglycine-generating enzyme required for sulfatase activity
MKHYLLSTITFLLLFGCGEEDFNDTKTVDEIIANAADSSKIQTRMVKGKELFFEINKQTPYSGWYKIMYPSGQVRLLSEVKEGLQDGKFVQWFENGQKKLEATFLKGESHGKASFYYKNGQLEQEVEWQNGLQQGKEISWYENGQVSEETYYHQGKADGISKTWAKNGDMIQELVFKNGNAVDIISKKEPGSRVKEVRKQEAQRAELRVRDTNAAFAKLGDRFTIADLVLEMLWVKHGAFMMGYKGEQHKVTLTKGFYLGKYEVTQAQWERVMGNNPSNFKGADRPVEEVSWNDAVEFCKKLTEMEKKAGRVPQGMSYQLPTEAQWEYACRAGTSTMYSWGDSISSSNANYDENVDETTPVGKYPANPWGFHDMHGNVWEWCADWYGNYPSGSVTNPIGPASGSNRVIRGGSWNLGGTHLRSARRHRLTPSLRFHNLGFRVGFQSSK